MREVMFLFLFGVCAFLGFCLAVFWGVMAARRWSAIERPSLRDRYFLVASCFALFSLGQAVIDAFRVYGNLHFGLSKILLGPEGIGIGAGLVMIFVALLGMSWLADLEVHPPKLRWLRRAIVFSVVWFGFVFVVHGLEVL